eukprot:scaffold274282_cov42-Attheya_sp.AAC.1
METLMDNKISSLMEKQFKEYIPKHITKVMKSWGRKNSSGGRHQPPTKPDGNTSNGQGSKSQPPAKNNANWKPAAKSTEPTGKPKDSGKRKKTAQAVPLEIPTEFETDSTLPGKKRKRLSRRKAQRGKRRQFQKKEEDAAETLARLTTQRIHTAEQQTIKECRSYYGFAADPDKPLWENIPYAISQMPPRLFLEQPEAE